MNYVPIAVGSRDEIDVPDQPGLKATVASAPSTFAPDGMAFNAISVSGSLVVYAGFLNFVTSTSTSIQYYLLDYLATQLVATPPGNNTSLYTVYGVGLRLAFKGTNVKGNASCSLGALAASATLNATATSFAALTVGLGLNMQSLPFVQALISTATSSFNVGTLQNIGEAFSEFADYLVNYGSSLTPSPVGILLNNGSQIQSVATSYGYALRCIAGENSFVSAQGKGVKTLPTGVQRLDPLLAATYSSLLSTQDSTATPTSAQKSLANQFNNCGP